MNILFLDDCPNRTKEFRSNVPFATLVSTVEQVMEKLPTREWDVLFLDHDLGGETYVDPVRDDCGSEIIRRMAAQKYDVKFVIVHTHNDEVQEAMVEQLRTAGYQARSIPFNYLHEIGVYDLLEQCRDSETMDGIAKIMV